MRQTASGSVSTLASQKRSLKSQLLNVFPSPGPREHVTVFSSAPSDLVRLGSAPRRQRQVPHRTKGWECDSQRLFRPKSPLRVLERVFACFSLFRFLFYFLPPLSAPLASRSLSAFSESPARPWGRNRAPLRAATPSQASLEDRQRAILLER